MVERLAERVADQLRRSGAVRSDDVAWAITALSDGAMLHRFAHLDVDHREELTGGLRLLVAAAMLRDDEIAELLARYDRSVLVAAAPDAATAPA